MDPAKNKEKIIFFIIERTRECARARPFLTFRMRIRNIYLVARSFFARFVYSVSSNRQLCNLLRMTFCAVLRISLHLSVSMEFCQTSFRCMRFARRTCDAKSKPIDRLFISNEFRKRKRQMIRSICSLQFGVGIETSLIVVLVLHNVINSLLLVPLFTLSILIFIALTQKKSEENIVKKAAQGGEAK